ncbi:MULTISPECIES: glycerol-3-phosphate dehydrogenase [unclassified Beijerinckia]|uniref:glycerol-3-phosphate dehydrogenase n=1 Tax=unclassified Beijerinckia TaxID=2638183 RepID=UPI0008962D3F|nr:MULTISPECIES: glycerol-3-phosphate dehydrogenase [unclassified Beijerinckia]MDH7797385.1 glycerol-3-phosphate dehydrogenase [Beijerinckia sp. GAS462]SEC83465.1 homodimeric glycerol 3-phosphate dehydrogenase (quinone) [Beijerinckia sp. 28-YEA-48]
MFDLVVVGGGINGCGIARDAAGRGLSVGLIEMNDLASGTSSASTKLIHGGLRYLEHWQFALVREALIEREVLLRIAPHLVRPMRFVLPVLPGMRPAWMLRAGLFLYDHLDRHRTLPGTVSLDLRTDAAGQPLRPGLVRGFEYSDCAVDDARLVILNARDAADRGAVVRTRTKMLSAARQEGLWRIEVMGPDGSRDEMRARALVNAAGPWAGDVANRTDGKTRTRLRLDQGSHIVVRRLFAGERSYIFQNGDGRIVFAIPYHRDFTLIGTTDHDFSGDPAKAAPSAAEIDYLIAAANLYFSQAIGRTDVVWSYAGVRALVEGEGTAASATREYRLETAGNEAAGDPPLIHVFGGKITAYRPLAEKALALLSSHFPAIEARGAWTGQEPLPGGYFGEGGIAALEAELTHRHPWLDYTLLSRWLHAYGTDTIILLGGASGYDDLGQSFGAGLFEREVDWLIHREWAMTTEDILWRRSKLGLSMSAEERDGLNKHLAQRFQ